MVWSVVVKIYPFPFKGEVFIDIFGFKVEETNQGGNQSLVIREYFLPLILKGIMLDSFFFDQWETTLLYMPSA